MSGKGLAEKKEPISENIGSERRKGVYDYKSVMGLCCGTSHFIMAQAIR